MSAMILCRAGVLTKAPSTGLHEVTTLTFRGHADEATDLASFFTASKHPPIVKKQSEEKKIKLSNRRKEVTSLDVLKPVQWECN